MKSLCDIFPEGYLLKTYSNKMCINCRNNCSNCTLSIDRLYIKNRGDNIPTAIYKCNMFVQKS